MISGACFCDFVYSLSFLRIVKALKGTKLDTVHCRRVKSSQQHFVLSYGMFCSLSSFYIYRMTPSSLYTGIVTFFVAFLCGGKRIPRLAMVFLTFINSAKVSS